MSITEDDVREVVERAGLACIMYYPEIHVDDDEYDLKGQAAWCLEPVTEALTAEARDALSEMLARTIVDPTEHRERAFDVLTELAKQE